ncbi:serpin family protein [Avipoxvirus sp.]|nr:serpin family protein [Avipoxvirus sp.]
MFAISVLKELYDSGEPLLFSPRGLHKILCNIRHGCNGNTKNQLDNLLEETIYDYGEDQALKHIINNISVLLIKRCYNINEKIIKDSNTIYNTDVLEFYNVRQITRIMNKWIRSRSNNKITDIGCHIYDNTKSIIAEAMFFTMKHESIFGSTRKDTITFYKYDGTSLPVEAIHADPYYYPYRYFDDIKCSVLQLWKLGYAFNMFIILPDDEKGLDNLVDNITGDVFSKIMTEQMDYKRLELRMPVFSISQETNFCMPIFNLGCHSMFIDGDFSGISEVSDFQLSGIIQKNIIEVQYDKVKTTKPLNVRCSSFYVNKPFIFIVTDVGNYDTIPILLGIYQGSSK